MRLNLFAFELAQIKVVIEAVLVEQLLVRALLNDLTILDNQ
jgi:hypothetical protein